MASSGDSSEAIRPSNTKAFEYNRQTAQSDEDDSIDLEDLLLTTVDRPCIASAITSDYRYLAIATDNVIRVYDVGTQTLTSEMIPLETRVTRLMFSNYVLYSQCIPPPERSAHEAVPFPTNAIHEWPLNAGGKFTRSASRPSMDVDTDAASAVSSLVPKLNNLYYLDARIQRDILEGFTEVLRLANIRTALMDIRQTKGTFLARASDTDLCSHNGRYFLVVERIKSEQMEAGPSGIFSHQISIKGTWYHDGQALDEPTDDIVWAGWSHDDRIIAIASADGTCGFWDVDARRMLYTIMPFEGEIWGGAFLPNGKLILSGGKPVKVRVYEIDAGREVGSLEVPGRFKLQSQLRSFAVHPITGMVMVGNGFSLLAWKPLEEGSEVEEIFSMDGSRSNTKGKGEAVWMMKWVDQGKKFLAHECFRHTTFVWDIETNLKWRFEQRVGAQASSSSNAHFVKSGDTDRVLIVSGDGKMRFEKLVSPPTHSRRAYDD